MQSAILQMEAKDLLLEILDYYRYKIDKNLCMPEEVESATRLLGQNMKLYGTIGDFAEFYGKSKDAVNPVIKRQNVMKPKRNVVLYPFHIFRNLVPRSWRK